MTWNFLSIRRHEVKRGDNVAFTLYAIDAVVAVLVAHGQRRHFGFDFFPGAGRTQTWRIVPEAPADRHCLLYQYAFVYRETHKPLGANKSARFFAVPDNLCRAGQVQQIPTFKIDEQDTRPRIDRNVSERIEEVIAGKIGEDQRLLVFDSHESGLATAMRHVRTVPFVASVARELSRDEEMVRCGDDFPRTLIETIDWQGYSRLTYFLYSRQQFITT